MAAPPKPWENAGVNRQAAEGLQSTFMSGSPAVGGVGMTGIAGAPTVGSAPPPVPSRPTQQSGYSTFGSGYGTYGGGYSSPYMGYGGGMYNSPYSSMYGGGYGSTYGGLGYNRLGYGQNEYSVNSFARQAEESSRPAFQSIESIVGAFSSVSMMLDSTFQAVYSSFRAVIGVADNFSRMKMQFAQIFSAFAIFRTLRYLYRKLLVLLRLRPQGYAEEAWTEAGDALANAAAASPPGRPKKSSWPVLMFMAIIFGGPYLIWKFLKTAFSDQAGGPAWATGEEDHFVAQALYSFQGDGTDELSFQAGQNINVAPKEQQPRMKGWLLACVDGKTIGIIPANYVKILGKRRGRRYEVQSGSVPSELQNQSNPNTQSVLATSSDVMPAQGAASLEQNLDSAFQEPGSNLDSVFQGGNGQSGDTNSGTANMNAEDILDQSTD